LVLVVLPLPLPWLLVGVVVAVVVPPVKRGRLNLNGVADLRRLLADVVAGEPVKYFVCFLLF
jgi:hypothetical protein